MNPQSWSSFWSGSGGSGSFLLPSPSWLLLGLVCRQSSSWGLEKRSLASIFQLNTRRLTLLKTSTSASGLGQKKERRGREERRFITFVKFRLQLGPFWHTFMKFQFQSRRVLTAFHRRPLFRPTRGYRTRQEGEGQKHSGQSRS